MSILGSVVVVSMGCVDIGFNDDDGKSTIVHICGVDWNNVLVVGRLSLIVKGLLSIGT